MDKESVIISFEMVKRNITVDIEVPLDISADELIKALNTAYSLDIDTSNPRNCYIQAENPITLLKGNRLLREFGIRNGSVVIFTR